MIAEVLDGKHNYCRYLLGFLGHAFLKVIRRHYRSEHGSCCGLACTLCPNEEAQCASGQSFRWSRKMAIRCLSVLCRDAETAQGIKQRLSPSSAAYCLRECFAASITMMVNSLSLLAAYGMLSGLTSAQFPPTPEGVTVLDSHIEDGIRISYKEVSNCVLLR